MKKNIQIIFDKEGMEKNVLEILDARNPGEYEIQIVAEHKVANTKGRITIRAVVGAGAKVRLYGLIKIEKDAHGTDSFLELRALTLDKMAIATVEPELEIEANEVKASHGASVGPVDSEQILYMMSRGLNRTQAIDSVISGWLGV